MGDGPAGEGFWRAGVAARERGPHPRATSGAARRPPTRDRRSPLVRRDVQAPALLFLAHPQADHDIDDLVGHDRDQPRPDDRDWHRLELNPELRRDRIVGRRHHRHRHPVAHREPAAERRELKTPVSSAPTMPPTPCTPNTSSESSMPSMRLSPRHAPQAGGKPATMPNHHAADADVCRRPARRPGRRLRPRPRPAWGLPVEQRLADRPRQYRGGGGGEGVHERQRGETVGLDRPTRR